MTLLNEIHGLINDYLQSSFIVFDHSVLIRFNSFTDLFLQDKIISICTVYDNNNTIAHLFIYCIVG